MLAVIVDRIGRFLAEPADEATLCALAREALRFQHRSIPAIRRLCTSRGIDPARLEDWRRVPLVPTSAFKTVELCAAPAELVFRSSGTTRGRERRSVHRHPYSELYRQVIDASFPAFCLPRLERPPMLSLIPGRELLPDSSLSFMIDHVLERHGGGASLTACGERGVEVAAAADWLARQIDAGRPCLLLATSLALLQLLDGLGTGERLLPPGSVLFETGGFKGRRVEIAPGELLERVEAQLGIPRRSVVREYGMTELTSQAYTRALAGGDPDLFFTPHWMRVRILDPRGLEEAPPGGIGLVAIFDLANVGSALHLLTEDLGSAEPGGGFRLHGRASGAELRGCSLVAEELSLP